jgi:hypothetical protein
MPDILSGILQGIQLGQQRQAVQARQKLDEQTQADANSKEMERVKQEQDRINQQRKEFDATHEINLANLELNKKAAHLKMMAEEAALSPQVQSDLAAAKQAPITAAETARDEAEAKRRLGEIDLQRGYAAQVQRQQDDAAMTRTKLTTDTDKIIAGMRASAVGIGIDPEDAAVVVKKLINREMTRDELYKIYPAKIAMPLANAVIQSGNGLTTESQNKDLALTPVVSNAIKLVKRAIDLQPDVGNNPGLNIASGLYGRATNADLSGAFKMAEGQILLVGQELSKTSSRSFSDPDREVFSEGNMPKMNDSKANNILRMKNMVRVLNTLVDGTLKTLSPAQRKKAKDDLGISEINNLVSGKQSAQGSPKVQILGEIK